MTLFGALTAALMAMQGGGAQTEPSAAPPRDPRPRFSTPVRLPEAVRIDIVIERTRKSQQLPLTATGSYRLRQEITATKTGYRVRQRLVSKQYPPDMDGFAQRRLDETTVPVDDVAYNADRNLLPSAIVDWEALRTRLSKPLVGNPRERNGTQELNQHLLSLNASAAAPLLLRFQPFVSAPQGQNLALGQAVSKPIPLGDTGVMFATSTATLENLDAARSRALIVIRQESDVGATLRAQALIRATNAKAPKGSALPTEAQIQAVRVEQSGECRSEMDMVSGLAIRTECTFKSTVPGNDLRPVERSDQWVISQTVVPQSAE